MASIFLIDPQNKLTELKQAEYESEDLLQKLLASYPSLLSFGQNDNRLLLVRREFGVPEEDDGSARWSLDHLFLDAGGVPVLVEVKRATDTRARREVVAQMLDYAANGVAYWPLDGIVQGFRATCMASGQDPDLILSKFLDGADPDPFWRQVEANLRSGRIRMVFVADKIARELRRIVEFLNEQMRPAEVMAIEVEQFLGEGGVRTLVPRIVGRTERAETAKSIGTPLPPISEDQWLTDLSAEKGEPARIAAAQAVHWLRSGGFVVEVSDSQDSIGVGIKRASGKISWPFFIRKSSGRIETALQYLKSHPAYAGDEARSELLSRIKKLPCKVYSTEKLTGWPSIALEDLLKPNVWTAFQEILLQVKETVQGVGGSAKG